MFQEHVRYISETYLMSWHGSKQFKYESNGTFKVQEALHQNSSISFLFSGPSCSSYSFEKRTKR